MEPEPLERSPRCDSDSRSATCSGYSFGWWGGDGMTTLFAMYTLFFASGAIFAVLAWWSWRTGKSSMREFILFSILGAIIAIGAPLFHFFVQTK